MSNLISVGVADVRYALRQLRRRPSLAVAAVLCFALGIGANTSIFSVVDAVLFRPLPFPEPDRLVLIGEALPQFAGTNFGVISAAEYADYKALNGRVFDASSAHQHPPGLNFWPRRCANPSGSKTTPDRSRADKRRRPLYVLAAASLERAVT